MVGKTTFLLPLGAVTAAIVLIAAQPLPTFAQEQAGIWDVSGLPGVNSPVRQCIADVLALARFEHRSKPCTARVLKNAGGEASVEYSCGAAGFGHADLQVITPRSIRIATQGISDGLPFNYVLQARRVGDCAKQVPVASRH